MRHLLGLFSVSVAVAAVSGTQHLPSRFEEAVPGRQYVAHASGYQISLSWAQTSIALRGAAGGEIHVGMRFEGAGRAKALLAEDPLPGQINYYNGSDPSAWRSGAKAYRRVRSSELYRGIDAVFYTSDRMLEYDFVVRPGADPSAIRMRITGAAPRIEGNGDLVLASASGDVRWKKPVIYQTSAGGVRTPVEGRFDLASNGLLSFRLGAYDRARELIIDPVLDYSTYLGGSGNDAAKGIAIDSAGNVFISGITTSAGLAVTPGAAQPSYGGNNSVVTAGDAFLAKFSPAGTLIFLTYMGGSQDEFAIGVAVDSGGNAWITGSTTSTNFPTTANARQRTHGGTAGNLVQKMGDCFLARFSPTGALQYSSFFGGNADDFATAIALDSTGNVFITGSTLTRANFATAGAAQTTYAGQGGEQEFPRYGVVPFEAGDAFLAKFDATGTQLVFCTYWGGNRDDLANSIAVDATGAVYIGGYTLSANFPTSQGALQTVNRGSNLAENIFWNFGDGFVAKFSPTGTPVYSTMLGGACDDFVGGLAVDSTGNAYVTGGTCSSNFPVTAGAAQTRLLGPSTAPVADQVFGDAFVAKINPGGTALLFATYLGGNGDEVGSSIALDAEGNIFTTGFTDSFNFPFTTDAFQRSSAGAGDQNFNQNYGDAYIAQLNPQGSRILFASYLGGNFDDVGYGIALDRSGNAFVAGNTVSRTFPTTARAVQATYGGTGLVGRIRGDAFLSKISGFSSSGSTTSLTALQQAASYVTGSVAPGMVFVAYGNGIGPAALAGAQLDSSNQRLATTVSETQILFDEVPAPIVYVSNGQSSGVVPYQVAGKSTTQVVAVYRGVRSAPLTVNVAPALPGLFSANFTGTGQGAIFNQNSTPNSPSNPARRGDIVVLYGTGEGQTNPAGDNGKIAGFTLPLPAPTLPVTATIGGQNAQVLYSGAVSGVTAGVIQFNVVVPTGIGTGPQPVVVRVGNAQTQANLTVSVQ